MFKKLILEYKIVSKTRILDTSSKSCNGKEFDLIKLFSSSYG